MQEGEGTEDANSVDIFGGSTALCHKNRAFNVYDLQQNFSFML